MQRFYNVHPEWVNPDPNDLIQLNRCIRVMEKHDAKFRRVVILIATNVAIFFANNPEILKTKPDFLIQFQIWLLDRLSRDVYVQVGGLVLINSFIGAGFQDRIVLSRNIKIKNISILFGFLSKCTPIRFAGGFILDAPYFLRALWPVVRMFLSEKIRNRYHFCGTTSNELDNLIIDKTILLVSLGGRVPDSDYSYCWITNQVNLYRDELNSPKEDDKMLKTSGGSDQPLST